MITGINGSKTLAKHPSCECECTFDWRMFGILLHVAGFQTFFKRMWMYIWLKNVWNPATCSCENGQYLTSIMVDSEIMCDEIIESCEEDVDVETKSNQSVKRKNSIFYLHFY